MRRVAGLLGLAGPASRWSSDGADPARFLAGLWHGFVVPLSALVHYFAPDAASVYEVNNGGHLYRLGFFLGVAIAIQLAVVLE